MSGALFKTTILEVESFSDAAREAKGSMHPRSSCGSCASPVSLADRSPAPALRWLLSPRQGQSSPSTPGSCLCPASCAPGGPLPHGTSSRLSRARSISAREIQLDLMRRPPHRRPLEPGRRRRGCRVAALTRPRAVRPRRRPERGTLPRGARPPGLVCDRALPIRVPTRPGHLVPGRVRVPDQVDDPLGEPHGADQRAAMARCVTEVAVRGRWRGVESPGEVVAAGVGCAGPRHHSGEALPGVAEGHRRGRPRPAPGVKRPGLGPVVLPRVRRPLRESP